MNYIPHYTKRLKRRANREQALRRQVECGASESKLLDSAAQVLAARIAVVKMHLAKVPWTNHPTRIAERDALNRQISDLNATSPDTVLSEFRHPKQA